jgi:hypothetical protein
LPDGAALKVSSSSGYIKFTPKTGEIIDLVSTPKDSAFGSTISIGGHELLMTNDGLYYDNKKVLTE